MGAWSEKSNATGVNGNSADNSLTNAGAAYVYKFTDSGWVQEAYLKASNTDSSDRFGVSVAISGSTIAIGAFGESGDGSSETDNSESNSGAVYVFSHDGSAWSQQAYLKAPSPKGGDSFGRNIDIYGNSLIVSSQGDDSSSSGVNSTENEDSDGSGAAYIFTLNGDNWSQTAYLKINSPAVGDNCGNSVAISNNFAAMGCDDRADKGSESGAVVVYSKSNDSWELAKVIHGSNTEAEDSFGRRVAFHNDFLIAVASGEDSNAAGVNGDGSDNSVSRAGATYVFDHAGGSWEEVFYLKAAHPSVDDFFGRSITASGESVFVGNSLDDSNATSINGDGSNNEGSNIGAVVEFKIP